LNGKVADMFHGAIADFAPTRRLFLRAGFTLIELLSVVLILGALAALVVPRVVGGAVRAKVTACRSNVSELNKQIEICYLQEGEWPSDLDEITSNPK
jgi:general secretion pathway protein G